MMMIEVMILRIVVIKVIKNNCKYSSDIKSKNKVHNNNSNDKIDNININNSSNFK